MGCNCNQSKSGATVVYQHHLNGAVKTYLTQADAEVARTRANGQGMIIRTTQTPG